MAGAGQKETRQNYSGKERKGMTDRLSTFFTESPWGFYRFYFCATRPSNTLISFMRMFLSVTECEGQKAIIVSMSRTKSH